MTNESTKTDVIQQALQLIESSAADQVSVHFLAEQTFFSGSHLHKLFKLTTGQSLMDYARGRKLARSLTELFDTDLRIIDIAHQYGFRHEQSYIRAFFKEYGCTPGDARKSRQILPIREQITPDRLHSTEQGLLYGHEVVMSPSMKIIGMPHRFTHFDNVADAHVPNLLGKRFFYEEANAIRPVANPDIYIGYIYHYSLEDNDVEYMPSLPVNELSSIPQGFRGIHIPAHTCIRFRYIGEHHYDDLSMSTAKHLYEIMNLFFIQQTAYQFEPYNWERIDRRLYDGTFCTMDWLFPVREHGSI